MGEINRDVKINPYDTLKALGKWVFAGLFIVGGVGHFLATDVYMKIMPPYLPYHRALVLLSGAFEVILGVLLLVPTTSRLAAWGLVALLASVFPANVYMYQHPELFALPPLLLLMRLPLQGVLILWAYDYTRR
jgi:uncharacterized membrane protein